MLLKFLGISLVFLVSGIACQEESCQNGKVVFCYYSSWAVYRESFGNYNISNIDPFLCTHYVFSFAGLSLEGEIMSLDPQADLPENGGMQQYYHFRMMKEKNPCIKVLISIGGWDEGSEKYSVMVEDAESRKKFIDHALRFIIYYGFDGIDVDWEYPTQRGGIPQDKQNFVLLLKEFKERLSVRGKLLSTAVGAGLSYITQAYDVAEIAKHVDYVLLMTYDYNRADVTTHLAPLRRNPNDVNEGSIAETVEKWIELGCPPSKLVMGVQTSGRTYTLTNPSQNALGSPAKGPGHEGLFTRLEGFLSYYEICFNISAVSGWSVNFVENPYGSVYATRGDQWVTYEDTRSIKQKTKYAVDKQLAGMLVWTIDTDDFYPLCGSQNTLQKAMREELGLPVRQNQQPSAQFNIRDLLKETITE